MSPPPDSERQVEWVNLPTMHQLRREARERRQAVERRAIDELWRTEVSAGVQFLLWCVLIVWALSTQLLCSHFIKAPSTTFDTGTP